MLLGVQVEITLLHTTFTHLCGVQEVITKLHTTFIHFYGVQIFKSLIKR